MAFSCLPCKLLVLNKCGIQFTCKYLACFPTNVKGPGESRSLSTEEGHLLENVDNRVLDGPEEQLVVVAKLAKRCINLVTEFL